MLPLPKDYLAFEGKEDVTEENVAKLRPMGRIEWSDLQSILSEPRRPKKSPAVLKVL